MIALLIPGRAESQLYPLSLHLPKTLLPVCDRELLHYQVAQLARAGISELVIPAGRWAEQLAAFTQHYSGGLRFHLCPGPQATADALALAQELAEDAPLLLLNADVLSALDIAALLLAHAANGQRATVAGIILPATAGGIALRTEGERLLGLEARLDSDPSAGEQRCSAGACVLEPAALSAVPLGLESGLERVLLPELLKRHGALGFFAHTGFWADAGSIEGFFNANFALLAQRYTFGEAPPWGAREDCAVFKDLIYLHHSVSLERGTDLYHRVIVMAGCSVGSGCRLHNTLLLPGASVGEGVRLRDCLVGPGVVIGDGEQLSHCVLLAGAEPTPFYPEAVDAG